MRKISIARRTAFEVLLAVEGGAYASDTLRESARRLEARDAGLASQIVFGCLRFQGQLDYLIARHSGRSPDSLEPVVATALRAAIFQLRYLERVPAHAAVHESVEWVKSRKRAAAGLVNAVLRKVNRDQIPFPNLAIELSCPEWLLASWTEHFGAEQARQIAAAALREPERYIRVPPGRKLPEDVEVEPTPVPGCFRVLRGSHSNLRLHDISAQAILPLLDLQTGNSYLDLCAAPGNKTLQALETALSVAVACDINLKRLKDMPPVCPRVILDATHPLPFGRGFDRIFIDAPCSGTGTLARNPEIKWRVQKHDLVRFGQRQKAIISQALAALDPGGKLLYATCSLEREENEDVIATILAERPDFRCERAIWRVPGKELGDGFYSALLSRKARPSRV